MPDWGCLARLHLQLWRVSDRRFASLHNRLSYRLGQGLIPLADGLSLIRMFFFRVHDLNSLKRKKKFSSYWHHVWQVRP
jgi:hypothetical protein